MIWTLGSCSLAVKRATKIYNSVKKNDIVYDAIIVPGYPWHAPGWDSIMKARVLWSVFLYNEGKARNIIFSGAAVYSPYYEALIMGEYAKKLKVNPEHIYYDTLAKHSTENVYYAYKIAKAKGFKSIALATDPVQSFLLQSFTKKRFHSNIQHIPIIFEIIQPMNFQDPKIDPSLAYKVNFVSILNSESFFKRLRGTLGRNLKYGTYKRLGPL